MIDEYDQVRIIESGIIGTVVDVFEKNGKTLYTVESDKKGVPGGAGENDSWKLFVCSREEIEKV